VPFSAFHPTYIDILVSNLAERRRQRVPLSLSYVALVTFMVSSRLIFLASFFSKRLMYYAYVTSHLRMVSTEYACTLFVRSPPPLSYAPTTEAQMLPFQYFTPPFAFSPWSDIGMMSFILILCLNAELEMITCQELRQFIQNRRQRVRCQSNKRKPLFRSRSACLSLIIQTIVDYSMNGGCFTWRSS
jgi:hypothetical protein